MIVGVLTTCHTQNCSFEAGVYVFFLFNRTTSQVFVTYLTGALYVPPLPASIPELKVRIRTRH